ncbi:hypothetical protein [Nostoc sp.]
MYYKKVVYSEDIAEISNSNLQGVSSLWRSPSTPFSPQQTKL